ncbi:MAG: LysR family transcriptional regulator [Jannaschia sp.]
MLTWKDIPPLVQLRAFEAVARLGSFSAAARDLNVTHPAVAQHVRNLEAHLSRTLVVREGRGVALTAAGQDLALALSEGFETIAVALDRLRDDENTRPLSLSVTPAFAANWLMPRIGDFWTRHADIPLNILPNVEVIDLRAGDIDMAIRHGSGNWPGVDSELLTDGDFWVVVHPALLNGRRADCVGDVAGLPWLMEHYMLERRSMIEQAGIDLDAVKMQLMGTNWMVLSAAQAGQGVTVQPRTLIERQVAAGQLVKVCALGSGSLGYYMVTLPGRMTARVRLLRRWLIGQVAGDDDRPDEKGRPGAP